MGMPFSIMRNQLLKVAQSPTASKAAGGMLGAVLNKIQQEEIKSVTNQAVNPGLSIAPGPGKAVVAYSKSGVPIYGEVQAAPSGGGGGGGGAPAPAPAPGPDYAAQITALNQQAADYRKQAEEIIAQGQAKVKELEDADLQRQKAAELQNRLAIQSAANQARGQMGANLQIQPAGQIPATAGTEGFKRRANQFGMTRRSASTGPVNPYEQVNV